MANVKNKLLIEVIYYIFQDFSKYNEDSDLI